MSEEERTRRGEISNAAYGRGSVGKEGGGAEKRGDLPRSRGKKKACGKRRPGNATGRSSSKKRERTLCKHAKK